MKVHANGIDIEVEDSAQADASHAARPAVLLIMGLGMQLIAWPDEFVQALVDAGFRVIRFDNRDVGLSQHLDELGIPNIVWESLRYGIGMAVHAPYSIADMAADAVGVLDALGVACAHIVGVSLGGMVAQRVAIGFPQRVLSLTSIMSSSGARFLPGPKPRVLKALLARPAVGEQAIVDHYVRLFEAIGSPGFPMDEPVLRERMLAATRRSFHPAGALRQMTAVAADVDRADELERVTAPTLVIHGMADPLVPVACGHDTARRIRGSHFVTVPGMGHDLAPGVVERLLQPLIPHLQAHNRA